MSTPAPLTISVVTPSFRQAGWLRLCAASVADQRAAGLEIEHIVQDALSGPEVAEAVRPFPGVRLVSEKDEGMYDAINRGWARAHGDILCWLNCDEQYLPGTLEAVADYFRANPETDILFADAIIVDGEGAYVCSRQVLTPTYPHTITCHLQTFSCATFFRGSLMRERGFHLDPQWKMAGDAEMIIRMLKAGVRMELLGRYGATFVDHGDNLGLQPRAREERDALAAQAPAWIGALHPVWKLLHRLRRWSHGHYRPEPFTFDIYTPASPHRRVHVAVPQPMFYWSARMQ
jgi:glycosyltransferase involved in cell wall biosynthesis